LEHPMLVPSGLPYTHARLPVALGRRARPRGGGRSPGLGGRRARRWPHTTRRTQHAAGSNSSTCGYENGFTHHGSARPDHAQLAGAPLSELLQRCVGEYWTAASDHVCDVITVRGCHAMPAVAGLCLSAWAARKTPAGRPGSALALALDVCSSFRRDRRISITRGRRRGPGPRPRRPVRRLAQRLPPGGLGHWIIF
jgi:hypothetical protein